jgi:ribosomal protein S18 acetylase RimI-like enzyme
MRRTASQEIDPSLPLTLRAEARAADIEAVRRLVEATGFFSEEEEAIALELVEERLLKGESSGYDFLFAHRGGAVVGYACYGRIPLTRSSYDLYWIVVDPAAQGSGVGRALIAATEAAVRDAGGTALYAETSSRDQYAPTRGFYRAAGYAVAAEFPDFYAPGDGKIVFAKRLTER